MKKDFLTLLDLDEEELFALLKRSAALKTLQKRGKCPRPLAGRSVGLIFEKRSTRTRLSFEVGVFQFGGQPVFMKTEQMQLSRGEPIKDTARVMSRYLDLVVIRNDSHSDLEEFARFASVPVINALSDLYHPCQILSDLFTISEAGRDVRKMKLAYIGDPNNVFNSWINACAMIGFELRLASPRGYDPNAAVLKRASQRAALKFRHFHDPAAAVKGADVVYTDVWVSMGQEKAAQKKYRAFKGFQVDQKLLKAAGNSPLVLHCLPAHRNQEITEQVMEEHSELIFEQAENRLHCQKAVMEKLAAGRSK
jgi:ornithine carbamoyltransferase